MIEETQTHQHMNHLQGMERKKNVIMHNEVHVSVNGAKNKLRILCPYCNKNKMNIYAVHFSQTHNSLL